jgi:hypothetical protein
MATNSTNQGKPGQAIPVAVRMGLNQFIQYDSNGKRLKVVRTPHTTGAKRCDFCGYRIRGEGHKSGAHCKTGHEKCPHCQKWVSFGRRRAGSLPSCPHCGYVK